MSLNLIGAFIVGTFILVAAGFMLTCNLPVGSWKRWIEMQRRAQEAARKALVSRIKAKQKKDSK
jgi:hypothetical protein